MPEAQITAEKLELVFRITNIVVGILILIGGILCLVYSNGNFQAIIIGLFNIAFGAILAALELFAPEVIVKNCQFLFNFFGRGLAYLYLGFTTVQPSGYGLGAGIVILLGSALYLGLHFVPNMTYPKASGMMARGTTAPAAAPSV